MTSGTQNVTEWTNRTVYDPSGDKIGSVEQVWIDNESGTPAWLSVNTGLFGLKESFIPVQGLRGTRDNDLQTPFTKAQVKDAPSIDPDGDQLQPKEEQRLYRHYEVSGDTGTAADTGRAASRRTGDDDAMTRSEEHLRVGTETHETGRARLRKHVVTETEQVSVPVTREEVHVEREPITGENRGQALSGAEISEAEHEVTLHAERPVVDTEAVPVERVRLSKEQVADTETVSGEVRKERIDTDGIDGGGTSRHAR